MGLEDGAKIRFEHYNQKEAQNEIDQIDKVKKMKECNHDFGWGYPKCCHCDYSPVKEIPLTSEEKSYQKKCKHIYETYHYEVSGKGFDDIKCKVTRCILCYKKQGFWEKLFKC